jgi:hypothetical protein
MNLASPAVTQHFALASTIPPPRTHCPKCKRSLDEATWERMPFRGVMDGPSDPRGEVLSWACLHNCPCGTTISREVWRPYKPTECECAQPEASHRLPNDRENCGFVTGVSR